MVLILLLILGLIALLGFYTYYPPFGGRTAKTAYAYSPHYNRNKFQNITPIDMKFGFADWLSFMRRQARNRSDRKPAGQLAAASPDFKTFLHDDFQFMWLGHSTVLAHLGHQTILFDPVFSKRASPFQWVGPKRYATAPRLRIEDLPPIDAVVISHDHYDHLDYLTIKKLRTKAKHFFVPLGLKAHLLKWGIAEDAVTELDWWQDIESHGLVFVCTPARHFSGRGLTDRAATLWGSWVIKSDSHTIFFSGDGGYGPHFKKIGKKYGPFDMTFLECGQYDMLWPDVHMVPEQTIQAQIDLQGKLMAPIHWGAFTLALHGWTESVERMLRAAEQANVAVITPQISEVITPTSISGQHTQQRWWLS